MRAFALSATKGREKEVERLFLTHQGLEQIPEVIRGMDHLQVLDLSGNLIKDLPSWLRELSTLRKLELNGNRHLAPSSLDYLPKSLEELSLQSMGWDLLPRGLFQLPKLKSLFLQGNELREWPEEMPKDCPLQTLILDGNNLQRLPKNLKHLVKLRKLSLNQNQIKRLPAGLAHCRALRDLQIENNKLVVLPKSIGSLEKLETLTLTNNRLRQVPAELANCQMLQKLHLANNRLKNLPTSLRKLEWLRELDVSGNALGHCPEVVARCPRLRKLSLAGNKMKRLVTWQKAGRIEELDCSGNQLASVQELTALRQLQVLDLSNNRIQGFSNKFWHFPELKRLQAQRNPAKLAKSEFLDCPKLEVLQGLMPSSKGRQLLNFLALARQEDWREEDRAVFFDLYGKQKAAWEQLSVGVAWRGTQVQDPYFANRFRQWFYKNSPRRIKIGKGSRLLILGSLSEEGQAIYQVLSSLDISWTTDHTAAATHVIFGSRNLPAKVPAVNRPWYSEEQLMRQLDRLKGKPWSREISSEQLAHVRSLLWNQQEVNCHLALQLLRGSGLPKVLLADLLALFLRNPFPKLEEKLRNVLFPYLPDLIRAIVVGEEKPPINADDVKLWKRWLGTSEIKAETLISRLQ